MIDGSPGLAGQLGPVEQDQLRRELGDLVAFLDGRD
jgi:hypothetical protein